MNKVLAWVAAMISVALIAGCGGGSPPGAPTNVTATPHDSSAVVTWTAGSGVESWVWVEAGSTVSVQGCAQVQTCQIHRAVTSPYLVLGLTNGSTYSVIVNATSHGSPVGESSPPISFVPVPSGSTWTVGTPLSGTLLAIANTIASAITNTAFVAVGTGGALYSSANATTWTALTSNVATNLNAVIFGDSRFIVAGDAGLILVSTDSATWTAVTSGTTSSLYALALNGTQIVAVGANGTILVSSDGVNWTSQTSGTTRDLYGITYANSMYVAVGAEGTLLTSTNGVDWQTRVSQTSLNLRSVAYGAGTFAAVGAAGALVTSTDGVTWTQRTPIAANSLAGVVYGSQFVTVGSGGGIFTSADGVTWQAAVSGTTSDLNALTFDSGLASTLLSVGYVAVGGSGANLTSF